jgi:hypothetical protein
MMRYLNSPEKAEKQHLVGRKSGIAFIHVRPAGMEPSSMVKDACIDAVGSIDGADTGLASEAIGVLRQMASSNASEYSTKKALAAINSNERQDTA